MEGILDAGEEVDPGTMELLSAYIRGGVTAEVLAVELSKLLRDAAD